MRSTASTEIRPAGVDDIAGIAELGWRFIKFTPYGGLLGADQEGLVAALQGLLGSPDHGAWVVEQEDRIVGCLLAKITNPWCAPRVRIAAELAWWVDNDLRNSGAGIRLLREFEAWAAVHEASLVLSDLVFPNGPNLGDLPERLGYRLIERSHLKERL